MEAFYKMETNLYLNRYKNLRYSAFKKIYELNLFYKLILTFSFACFTGILAQMRFYLPGTLVPITGQVFAVLLAGVILGKYYGGFSQIMYLGLGSIGIPWFQGLSGGLAYLMGPTGGYLIGFVLAAFFIGFIIDKYVKSRNFIGMISLMIFSTFLLIYIPGLIWFYVWTGFYFGVIEIFTMCVLPFVFIDLGKSLIASLIAVLILPKKSYDN
jgi:biotin transport system substrate-specific component